MDKNTTTTKCCTRCGSTSDVVLRFDGQTLCTNLTACNRRQFKAYKAAQVAK